MLPAARSFQIFVVLLTLIGCATPLPRPTTTYGDVEARMPPIPERSGRFFFFTLDTMAFAQVDPIQLNGESVELLRVNHAFRGVKLNPGVYDLKLSYKPSYWNLSLVVFLVGLLVLLFLLLK